METEGARCAVHPDRAADGGTCTRCGSFSCRECVRPGASGPICLPCVARLEQARHVSRIPMLAIGMMVHGGLLLGVSILLVVYTGSLAWVFGTMPEAGRTSYGTGWMSGLLIGMGAAQAGAHLVPGALQMWSGWLLRSYQGRGLAIAALTSGILSVIGCYCAPTAILLLVLGLVVLLDGEVSQRFALGPAGPPALAGDAAPSPMGSPGPGGPAR